MVPGRSNANRRTPKVAHAVAVRRELLAHLEAARVAEPVADSVAEQAL
jgi:hypothetical protein